MMLLPSALRWNVSVIRTFIANKPTGRYGDTERRLFNELHASSRIPREPDNKNNTTTPTIYKKQPDNDASSPAPQQRSTRAANGPKLTQPDQSNLRMIPSPKDVSETHAHGIRHPSRDLDSLETTVTDAISLHLRVQALEKQLHMVSESPTK
ncbi:unnamed protein product [Echinostoma caproni]|uniref:Uncharacterized protein n=1 Tax=Echinostoma caproni TaxID=27848 RepID=A0A183B846_9TREM|nr:unnamed protein product [Echinostoma caproni]